MPDESTRSQVAAKIDRAVVRMQEDLPALSNLLGAFKDLLRETALFKLEIEPDDSVVLPAVDPELFRQGVPLATKESFRMSGAQAKAAGRRLGPSIGKGFPKIAAEVISIVDALNREAFAIEAAVAAVLAHQDQKVHEMAQSIEVNPQVLSFVLGRLLKPYAEKRAEWMAPACRHQDWTKGYCPMCGSWPALSFLKEKEGQRWLKCSFCAQEWRFMRTACPFCGNEDHEQLELLFSEDRKTERVETCSRCKRYIVGIDLRDRLDEPVMEVIPLALVYLDILAQEQGFMPGATTDWNTID
jgi:FdhE protein